MTWDIEVATVEAVAELAALKRTVEDRTYRTYGTPAEHGRSLDRYASVPFVRALVEEQCVLAARDDPGWCGMIAGRQDGEALFVHSLYVSRPGLGLGSALLRALVLRFDAVAIRAEVFARNGGALAFFLRHGFSLTDEQRPSDSYSSTHLVLLEAARDRVLKTRPAR